MNDGPGDSPRVCVQISNPLELQADLQRIEQVAVGTAESEGAIGEISISLVSAATMSNLNEEYMGEPFPTDVLSFPVDGLVSDPGQRGEIPIMIGEIVLCPEVAQKQAPDDPQSEMDLLVAHGVLHLLGFDHDTEEGAARMREREQRATGRAGARAT